MQEITEPITTKQLVQSLTLKLADEYSIKAAIWFLIGRGQLEIQRASGRVLLAKV